MSEQNLESNSGLKINLGGYDPTIVDRAFVGLTEAIAQHFNDRTRSLFLESSQKNALDKCEDCIWFHKGIKFCAVAPQNLAGFECEDRQLPERATRLDYLETRSPETIALLQELANDLDIEVEVLEKRLYEGWAKHREDLGLTTRGLLAEIEKIGSCSIAQMELIGDGIRLNMDDMVPCLIAGAIRRKMLAGRNFHSIMRWLLLLN